MLGPFSVLPAHGIEAHGIEADDWFFRIYASSREQDEDVTCRHLDSQRTLLGTTPTVPRYDTRASYRRPGSMPTTLIHVRLNRAAMTDHSFT